MISNNSKLAGPHFVWLFPTWLHPNWWNVSDADCGAKEMGSALEHSLRFTGIDEMTSNASRVLASNKVRYFNDCMKILILIMFIECVTVSRRSGSYS